MLEQLNYLAFGIILVLAIYLIFSFVFLGENQNTPVITQPVASPDTEKQIQDLEVAVLG